MLRAIKTAVLKHLLLNNERGGQKEIQSCILADDKRYKGEKSSVEFSNNIQHCTRESVHELSLVIATSQESKYSYGLDKKHLGRKGIDKGHAFFSYVKNNTHLKTLVFVHSSTVKRLKIYRSSSSSLPPQVGALSTTRTGKAESSSNSHLTVCTPQDSRGKRCLKILLFCLYYTANKCHSKHHHIRWTSQQTCTECVFVWVSVCVCMCLRAIKGTYVWDSRSLRSVCVTIVHRSLRWCVQIRRCLGVWGVLCCVEAAVADTWTSPPLTSKNT